MVVSSQTQRATTVGVGGGVVDPVDVDDGLDYQEHW